MLVVRLAEAARMHAAHFEERRRRLRLAIEGPPELQAPDVRVAVGGALEAHLLLLLSGAADAVHVTEHVAHEARVAAVDCELRELCAGRIALVHVRAPRLRVEALARAAELQKRLAFARRRYAHQDARLRTPTRRLPVRCNQYAIEYIER